MTLSVRAAVARDATPVEACVAAAFERYIERLGSIPRPMRLDFPSEIQAQHVWVADDEGKIAGVIVQYQTDFGFYIDTVAVLPGSQGTGVGKALLTFSEAEARRRGYCSIYLCTNSKMTENLVFYPRGSATLSTSASGGSVLNGSSMPRTLHDVVRHKSKLANIRCAAQVKRRVST